ncbi:hypothetical protein CLOLEP_03654 [[Clostridium] leptum DSM 753]|uniref:Uncharacterized protein n=1 Tax=[Clostridium] leptum DSM 753 TaxID=428125 RepID=A7VYH6_9FIRM|nr:hypothetical protein CLOLEP_03654 [[Clostridium] leptum DSM 753]
MAFPFYKISLKKHEKNSCGSENVHQLPEALYYNKLNNV